MVEPRQAQAKDLRSFLKILDELWPSEVLASSGHRVSIQIQEVGQQSIPATTELDGFQSPVKTPLLHVEQAGEKQNGGVELLGRDLKSGDIGHNRNRLPHALR